MIETCENEQVLKEVESFRETFSALKKRKN